MLELHDSLKQAELFQGISVDDLSSMLACLQAQNEKFQKGEYLLRAGEKPETIGVVLSGQLLVIQEDMDGNRTLLASIGAADMFAEAMCCAGVAESPVSVLADTDCCVMKLRFQRILNTCPGSCQHHQKLIGNMLQIVARKNLYLQNKLELLRTRSVRTRVLGYLNSFAEKHGEAFTIPLNREEMADYLCVDRSALSHELMRMKHDGLIEYRKNKFVIL